MKQSLASCIALGAIALFSSDAFAQCPALDALYPASEAEWPERRAPIEALLTSCLESAEYFALLGAARLNTGDLPGALEALERALLIEPSHGGAQVDYADALYRSGQLFAALELNRSLMGRTDLPSTVAEILRVRQQVWDRNRRMWNVMGEASAGYDTNLNGAPSATELLLTMSGESVTLPLNVENHPQEGPYANLRLIGAYSVINDEDRHDLLMSLRNRSSTHSSSDLVQFDWRYGYTRQLEMPKADAASLEVTAGTSHLLYGGSPLYSVMDIRSRLVLRDTHACAPLLELAGQYQRYHGQGIVSGIESSLAGGVQCQDPESSARVELEAGYLYNAATESERPGGDRNGWRVQMRLQYPLGLGALDLNAAYARLEDDSGYSALLNNGEARGIHNYQLRLNYQRPLSRQTRLFTGLNYQHQNSNLVPFRNKGTAVEAGVRHDF